MDLEPIFTQLVNEVLVSIVTTAVSQAMAKEAPAAPPSGDYMRPWPLSIKMIMAVAGAAAGSRGQR